MIESNPKNAGVAGPLVSRQACDYLPVTLDKRLRRLQRVVGAAVADKHDHNTIKALRRKTPTTELPSVASYLLR